MRVSLISLGITLGVVLLSAILIPLLFEDQIKGLFIRELNKNLATEITINQDDIHLSLLKNFPNAAVVFNNVGIRESVPQKGGVKGKSDKNFLEAEEISLVFNVWDIFKGNYTINNIQVKNGFCHLITDKKGNINYKFWKDSEGESSSDFSINLEQVDCEDINFQYRDYKYQQHIEMLIHNCALTGNFSSDNYLMQLNGDVLSKRIKIGGTSYLVNKETQINTGIEVDVPNENYTFKKGEITVDDNTFLVDGNIKLLDEDYYNLAINGDKITLEGLMLLLPGNISNNLSKYKSKGKIDFSSTIVGNYTKTKTPEITISFNVEDGSLEHEKFGGKLDNMQFTGKYSNGNNHNAATSYISIINFTAEQNKNPVKLSLNYKNFINPTIDLLLDGSFPASFIIPLAMSNVTDVEGTIGLNDINIKGNIKTLSSELAYNKPTGSITFDGVSMVINNNTITIPTGKAIVMNNEVALNGLNMDFAGSDLKVDLTINNWIENVFPSTEKPALNLNGNIRSDKIDLNTLIAIFDSGSEATEATPSADVTADVEPVAADHYNFSGNIDLSCNDFHYNKINFKQITAGIKLVPGLIIVNNLKGAAMSGNFDVDATFRELSNGDIILQTSGTLTNIDVAQLFEQFDNFDQTTLTEKNIKGRISANLYEMNIRWDKDFKLDEQSIYTLCDMKIENGELIDYKPLESLSGFVKMKELRHIKFSTLENKIEIKDRVIILPVMQIKSSALDMSISGKHTFDDAIDYQFKMSLADMMVRKFLGGNKQQDNYEEDAEGGVNVYISMTGTVNDPIIEYNKREAKQKLKESGLEEQRFIDIFKRDPEEEMFKTNTVPEKQTTTSPDEIEFIEYEDEL